MATDRSIIQPVFGLPRRKPSSDVLDTAETLVENLDSLADILDRLAQKYEILSSNMDPNKTPGNSASYPSPSYLIDVLDKTETLMENLVSHEPGQTGAKHELESKYSLSSDHHTDSTTTNGDVNNSSDIEGELVPERGTEHNLFSKLKTGLDSAKVLIGCLRREKGTLMKRQMSVECRMGEIEDYRQHMKEDLTSLNEMVDLLSLRVVQLESKLVDEQEAYESLEAEKKEIEERLKQLEDKESSTIETQTMPVEITSTDPLETRTNISAVTTTPPTKSNLTQSLEIKELRYKVEILVVENRKLKEIIRHQHKEQEGELESDLGTPRSSVSEYSEDLGTPRSSVSEYSEDGNNNNNRKFILVSDESDF